MGWITIAALFFVIWWVMLFASVPIIFHRSRSEESRSPATGTGTPKNSRRALFAVLFNTLVTAIIVGALAVAVNVYGLSPDVFPHIIPE
jgi:predicted secreted protein